MSPRKSVLGVSGVCWVGCGIPTQKKSMEYNVLAGLCWVCWVCVRARACTHGFSLSVNLRTDEKKSYAKTEKTNKPNTLNTTPFIYMILLNILCVEFVLGWMVLCWVGISRGIWS